MEVNTLSDHICIKSESDMDYGMEGSLRADKDIKVI